MPKMILTKADILSVKDVQTHVVEVPEWGQDAAVYVRVWDAQGRDTFEKKYGNKQAPEDESFRALVAALSICNEQGDLLFTTADIKELGKKNWQAMQRIFTKALDVNALTQAQKDELKKT